MKRSASPRSASQPEPVFVLDENLSGKSIVAGLLAKGLKVRPFADVFPRGMDDMALLKAISETRDLFLVTRDRDFRHKPDVSRALRRTSVGVFVLTASGNRTGEQLQAILIESWSRMVRVARKSPRPFIALVRGDGSVIIK